MLNAFQAPVFSDEDRVLFDRLVPYNHWTRRADARIDFRALRKVLEHHFSSEGRPAVEPILCLKLELLMFHDALSDRQVFAKAKCIAQVQSVAENVCWSSAIPERVSPNVSTSEFNT